MQVKKFEAKSMKEALEMVKNNLGPDAIILAVRDNRKAFGLVGDGSVEVTAAVSENTLRKKQIAESKLTEKDLDKFKQSPARNQKQFIEKMITQKTEATQKKAAPKQITSVPYIQIQDEQPAAPAYSAGSGRNVSDLLNEINQSDLDMEEMKRSQAGRRAVPDPDPNVAAARIRSAARDAWKAVQSTVEVPRAPVHPAQAALDQANAEILSLRSEIVHLKMVIEELKQVPQKFVSVHPGAEHGIPFELSFMYEKLSQAGIASDHIQEILLEAQTQIPVLHLKKKAMVDAWVAKYILSHIQIQENIFDSHVHLFVGGSGQGKTSTLVKMASHLVVQKRKRVAIVTTDVFKVGSVDQLRIYAQILNVPFAVIRDKTDWDKLSLQLGPVDHILVDYPGFQLKELTEINQMKRLLPPEEMGAKAHLVLSSNLKDSDAVEMARRYQITGFNDMIFTCIDESVQHGIMFNMQRKLNCPLHSFGIGPRIPEDFEEATKERVLDLIFKLTKFKSSRTQATVER